MENKVLPHLYNETNRSNIMLKSFIRNNICLIQLEYNVYQKSIK
jgi:hypothetical protein